MDTAKLKAQMVLHNETQEVLANALGVTTPRVSLKINGKQGAQFTQSEIAIIKNRYNLTPEEVDQIFFS